jgi:hypothetical protein
MPNDTKPLANAEVNRFRHSYDSTPIQRLTLEQALQEIKGGMHQSTVNRVRQVLARDGKPAYDRAKAHLQAFTFGGTFHPSRGNAHLQQHSCILHSDMDNLSAVAATKEAVSSDPRVVYVFISPSGIGLKAGVHIPVADNDADYKHAWQAVSTEFQQRYGGEWDPSGKDVSRLCYVSHDPTLYWNPQALCFEVPPAPIPEPRPPTPSRLVSRQGYDHQDYAEQAIRTAVQMIETAELGTRHHTRLKAARLLGGYVAGGLLTEDQAYGALAQVLVRHTLDLDRALKTIEDGLRYGQAHPITIEALEAERQAWLNALVSTSHNGQPRQRTVSAKSGGPRPLLGARYLPREGGR